MGFELCSEILDSSYFVHVRVNNTGRTIDHYNYWEDGKKLMLDPRTLVRGSPGLEFYHNYWLVVKPGPDLGSVGL